MKPNEFPGLNKARLQYCGDGFLCYTNAAAAQEACPSNSCEEIACLG